MVRPETKLTSYELWSNKMPTVKYSIVFGSSYYILRDQENLYKFNSKSDKRIFLGYSSHNKAYRVYNLRTQTIMKLINMVIDEKFKGICQERSR